MNFVFVEKEPVKRSERPVEAAPNKSQLPVLVGRQEQPRRVRPAAPVKPSDNRRANRKPVRLAGQVADGSHQSFACTVHDMSAMGAMLEMHPQETRRNGGELHLPERFYLVVENLLERSVVECYVMWRKGSRAGVQFVGPIDTTAKKLPTRKALAKAKPSISIRR